MSGLDDDWDRSVNEVDESDKTVRKNRTKGETDMDELRKAVVEGHEEKRKKEFMEREGKTVKDSYGVSKSKK